MVNFVAVLVPLGHLEVPTFNYEYVLIASTFLCENRTLNETDRIEGRQELSNLVFRPVSEKRSLKQEVRVHLQQPLVELGNASFEI